MNTGPRSCRSVPAVLVLACFTIAAGTAASSQARPTPGQLSPDGLLSGQSNSSTRCAEIEKRRQQIQADAERIRQETKQHRAPPRADLVERYRALEQEDQQLLSAQKQLWCTASGPLGADGTTSLPTGAFPPLSAADPPVTASTSLCTGKFRALRRILTGDLNLDEQECLPYVRRRIDALIQELQELGRPTAQALPPTIQARQAKELELRRLRAKETYFAVQVALIRESMERIGCDPETGEPANRDATTQSAPDAPVAVVPPSIQPVGLPGAPRPPER
jgi:hypothetical protein